MLVAELCGGRVDGDLSFCLHWVLIMLLLRLREIETCKKSILETPNSRVIGMHVGNIRTIFRISSLVLELIGTRA